MLGLSTANYQGKGCLSLGEYQRSSHDSGLQVLLCTRCNIKETGHEKWIPRPSGHIPTPKLDQLENMRCGTKRGEPSRHRPGLTLIRRNRNTTGRAEMGTYGDFVEHRGVPEREKTSVSYILPPLVHGQSHALPIRAQTANIGCIIQVRKNPPLRK